MAAQQRQIPSSQIVDGAGTARIEWRTNGYEKWTVNQVSISQEGGSNLGGVAALLYNGRQVTPMLATGDIASGDPPVELMPGEVLSVVWTNCVPGAMCHALIFYIPARF